MREEASVQDDLFVALVFVIIIIRTGVLEPSYQFRQAFTCCTQHFKLNVSCFTGLDSHIAFLQARQIGMFRLGCGHRKCSRSSTRQLCVSWMVSAKKPASAPTCGVAPTVECCVPTGIVVDEILVVGGEDETGIGSGSGTECCGMKITKQCHAMTGTFAKRRTDKRDTKSVSME